MDNPCNIESIYELQYFTCPTCIFKNHSKQEIINHAYETHPESIECLKNIKDEALKDLVLPWNENIPFESQNISKNEQETYKEPKIKEELNEYMDDQNLKYHVYTLDADGKMCEYGVNEDSENDNDLKTKIKDNIQSISIEKYVNNASLEGESVSDPEKWVQLKGLSVKLIPLTQSTLEHHLKVKMETDSTNAKVTNSLIRSCDICSKTFSCVQDLKIHI